MLNFIYDAYQYHKFYSRNNLQRNRSSFLKLTHILKNENFIDYFEMLNLHLLIDLDPNEYYNNKLVTHNRKMEINRYKLFSILKSIVERQEKDCILNLADVKFIKASCDAKYYNLFDNIYDWWEYTLKHGTRNLKDEVVKEILEFKIEKIDRIIQCEDFKSCHSNFSKFSWHKGIAAENGGGSHRLAYVIKLCQFYNVSAPYKTNLITYTLNREALENLFSDFSVYICFDFLVNDFNSLLSKGYINDIEYYSYTYTPPIKNNGKPDIVFFIIKNNYQSKVLKSNDIQISMDGKGRWVDNVMVERLWRSVKYEEVYLKAYSNVLDAKKQLNAYFEFYNLKRPHSSLDKMTPDEFYYDQLPQQNKVA